MAQWYGGARVLSVVRGRHVNQSVPALGADGGYETEHTEAIPAEQLTSFSAWPSILHANGEAL